MPLERRKFTWIEAGRGLAATLVVCYHATGMFSAPKYFGEKPLNGLFNFGYAGVDFFFVLSGFIILFAHRRHIGEPWQCTSYARRRFTRLFPTYWAVLLLIVAACFVIPSFGTDAHRTPSSLLYNATLLPSAAAPLLGVAWTLHHEVLFYALFATLILHPRFGIAAFTLWTTVTLAVFPFELAFPFAFLFNPINLEFGLGMVIALLILSGRIRNPKTCLGLGIGAFLIVGLLDAWVVDFLQINDRWRLSYGVIAAMIVYGLVGFETTSQCVAPKWFVFLGTASYSIYLVHFPCLSLSCKMLSSLGIIEAIPLTTRFLIVVFSSIAAGCAFHCLIERPLLRVFQRRRSSNAAQPESMCTVGYESAIQRQAAMREDYETRLMEMLDRLVELDEARLPDESQLGRDDNASERKKKKQQDPYILPQVVEKNTDAETVVHS